ncbi:MAG: serine/threonine protein phosphatase [Xanthobacteraceae bacterium]|nr:serine/threonine protein phosphatase [Xanthobacteraceae bacterium]
MDTIALTFAIGDVHGCFDKLDELMRRCIEYAGTRSFRFVMLGDYIDRGPDSRLVIDRLRGLCERRPNAMVCLMGNHEDLFLAALEQPPAIGNWIDNGGDATLESYDVNTPAGLPHQDIEWIRNLPLSFDDGLRFFVHAGIDPAVPLDQQDRDTMLWTRKRYPETLNPGRFVVHGHTPVRSGQPEQHPHRLNLDTGAVYGGPLSAAVFTADRGSPIALLVGSRIICTGDASKPV